MTQPYSFPTSLPKPATPAIQKPSAELGLSLLGPSAAMSQLWSQIRRLAPHVRTVLLTGDPDCGQEAVAHLLLDLSPAPRRSFVQISAADAENSLLRSSGLNSLPADIFLFLPDVDRFSPAAAEGLLRLMRTRRSRPFTVAAAATEDLRSLVSSGRFPAELAEVLTPIRMHVPCLKQRPEDLPMLLSHLFSVRAPETGRAIPHFSADLLRAAMEYSWPGNLRELARVTTLLLESSENTRELTAADFHRAVSVRQTQLSDASKTVRMVSLDTVVQEHINAILLSCRGNKLRAAEVLGISRSTLYRMLDAAAAHGNATLPIAS